MMAEERLRLVDDFGVSTVSSLATGGKGHLTRKKSGQLW